MQHLEGCAPVSSLDALEQMLSAHFGCLHDALQLVTVLQGLAEAGEAFMDTGDLVP